MTLSISYSNSRISLELHLRPCAIYCSMCGYSKFLNLCFLKYLFKSCRGFFLFQRDTEAQILDVSLHCNVKLMILYGFLRMSCK